LLTFSVSPKLNKYTDQQARAFDDQLIAKLEATPGATMVSAARMPLIAGWSMSRDITVERFVPASEGASDTHLDEVGAGYFRTMGIPLIAGREFSSRDNEAAQKVAIVNEAFVRHFLTGQNPLGRRLGYGAGAETKLDIEIVGVVKDSKYRNARQAPPAILFTPYLQQSSKQGLLFVYVRTAIDPEQLAGQARRIVNELDPNLPIRDMKTMQAQLDENLFMERTLSTLIDVFAALATVLAAIGLYGVLAYNIARRTREIGIRMALGADAGAVRGLVVREVALMLVVGAIAGALASLGAGRFAKSVISDVDTGDPLVYGGAIALLGLVALAAAYFPARRATSIHPTEALRYE
jgi:predicted permease